ncbi:hypothetical protein K505DRAFT_215835, partial [Melanomma pulvis-pyrius CBS 109.77]
LNNMLMWGIENSDVSRTGKTDAPKTTIRPEAVADLAKIDIIDKDKVDLQDKVKITLEDKVEAFKAIEEYIANHDNAINLAHSKLWTRLIAQLEVPEGTLRANAAWCCNTAVQNNLKTQERLLIVGAIPTLVKLATEDPVPTVRRKAVGALSSAARNFQPGLDAIISSLPAEFKPQGTLDAGDMESVDSLIDKLREN